VDDPGPFDGGTLLDAAAEVSTVGGLGGLLRRLRRRHAHDTGEPVLSYRELAAFNGWSHGAVGGYFAGRVLAPVDRFDALIRQLGATQAEQGALASARDRVDERRRAAGPPVEAPCFLPVDLPSFVGRAAERAALDAMVREQARSGSAAVVVICGSAGIGKTSLVAHWAHRSAGWFPGGRFLVDLRGFSPGSRPLSPDAAMRALLGYAGTPDSAVPASAAAQAAKFQQALGGRRALIVLDNVVGAEQIRPLLPAMRGCLVLVTSRYDLRGLVTAEGAHAITLGLPTGAEARQMLAARVGWSRAQAEPGAVDAIIASCARLPLAVAVVASRAAGRPSFSLAEISAELRAAEGCLDLLVTGDGTVSIPAALTWSYERVSPAAARLFRLFSVHPGPDLTVAAAASLAAVRPAAGQAILVELSRVHLITESGPGRYSVHDLLRAYAARRGGTADAAAARIRMLDHYLYAVRAAVRMLDPGMPASDSAVPAVADGTTRQHFPDQRSALAWLTAERTVLLAVLTSNSGAGLDPRIWQLARCLGEFVDRLAERGRTAADMTVDLLAARRRGDPVAESHCELMLGRLLRDTDRGAAREHLERALDLYQSQADCTGQGRAHRALSVLSELEGDTAGATDRSVRAMEMFWAAGIRAGAARGLEGLGSCYSDAGRADEADRYAGQAHTLRTVSSRPDARAADRRAIAQLR
jgi:hypothetical protein